MQIAAALSFEAFPANLSVIHPGGGAGPPPQRPADGHGPPAGAAGGLALWRPGAARNLQDPLSIRCIPQTHGALYDALSVARG